MNTLWKTYGNRMGTYENLCKPMENMKTYENLWKAYEIPMKTNANLMGNYENDGTLWKPMEKQDFKRSTAYYAARSAAAKFGVVLLYITRREAPQRIFWALHCILRGAKRRGEIFECFTVYYTARSAAAKFLSVFTVYVWLIGLADKY